MPRYAVLRCDASPRIGAGHVTRCLALAEALAETGWKVTFAVGGETVATVPFLASQGFEIQTLANADNDKVRRISPAGCDALLVDHYGLDEHFESEMRGWARRIVVLDDATGRKHDCDVLVDSAASAGAGYGPLVPAGCQLLLGPRYALLRKAFGHARERALARRHSDRNVREVLVSLGSTDPHNATSSILRGLAGVHPEVRITVVLSSRAPHLAEVRGLIDARTRLLLDSDDMPNLMASADLAIGASGATAFERALLGLPTIMVKLADNQDTIHAVVVAAGAAVDAGAIDPDFGARVAERVAQLISYAERRTRISMAASVLVDGHGPRRVVEALDG